MSNFNAKRANQEEFASGVIKFKLNPKNGILHFSKCGALTITPKSVAGFLFENREKLDKTQIGEVLGKEESYALLKNEESAEKGGAGFCVLALHEYVDQMDFSNFDFDEAIRYFLSGFRLPGEAQKIDRIMEKFAERYTLQNENIFPSADTAFILAFSIIMLNTDLHNPSIKEERRMTLEGFIRNNRGIGENGGDLPAEFLSGIFERIQKDAFSLKEDDEARQHFAHSSSTNIQFDFFKSGVDEKRRKEQEFQKEREALMASSESSLKSNYSNLRLTNDIQEPTGGHDNLDDTPSPSEGVLPMFETCWPATIGALSQILEFSQEPSCIALCLRGFVYAVRIAAYNDQRVARDTFVNSLAKFTTLGSIKEMRYKNIECVRTLFEIAIMDGELLNESWAPILQCVSQLSRLQQAAAGLATDDELFDDNDNNNSVEAGRERGGSKERKRNSFTQLATGSTSIFNSSKTNKALEKRKVEEENGKAVLATIEGDLIDKVFTSSVKLSVSGIEHMIRALILTSTSEVEGDPPRMFALQRLVEVADFNMNERPRIVWRKMWGLMSSHFTNVGCHSNQQVSMYAIDSLRQLSIKFLQKPELKDFRFQELFLEPFLVIMKGEKTREDTRELILFCLDNLIRSLATNIRSGWRIIFSCLSYSASDVTIKIAKLGLDLVNNLLDRHMRMFTSADDFVSLVSTSLSFVYSNVNLPVGLSMRALCHIGYFADVIARGDISFDIAKPRLNRGASSGSDAANNNSTNGGSSSSFGQSEDPTVLGYTYKGFESELDERESPSLVQSSQLMMIWRPIFDGLATGMVKGRGGRLLVIQRACVVTMRAILIRHGSLFDARQWEAILTQSIIPGIQLGALGDSSTCVHLYTQSPLEKNFEFLQDCPPLPPPSDDAHLVECSLNAQSEGSSAEREMGVAESLIEAALRDLRLGGDGSLKKHQRGYEEQKRKYGVTVTEEGIVEEGVVVEGVSIALEDVDDVGDLPSDSWTASTATFALGTLVDLFEVHLNKCDSGGEGAVRLFEIIFSTLGGFFRSMKDASFVPCEALLRINVACIARLGCVLDKIKSPMCSLFGSKLADLLDLVLEMQRSFVTRLILDKEEAVKAAVPPPRVHQDFLESKMMKKLVKTPFGAGTVVSTNDDDRVVVALEWGAMLYTNKNGKGNESGGGGGGGGGG